MFTVIKSASLKLLMALFFDAVARLKGDDALIGSSLIEYVSGLVF